MITVMVIRRIIMMITVMMMMMTMNVYRKNDLIEWSGNGTCTQMMSAMVEGTKTDAKNIQLDEIKLDLMDTMYNR